MRNIKLITICCLFLMIGISASAVETCPNDEIWYTSMDSSVVNPYRADGFGANVVSNTYADGRGIIKFNGNVTAIGLEAFQNCKALSSIIIPNSVTVIRECAFYECMSLTSVTISDSVSSIKDCAFYNCAGLTDIKLPSLVTSIGGSAFYECKGLKSVIIPDSVKSIGGMAFCGCSSLESLTLGQSVISLRNDAFERCSALKELFYNTDSLESFNFPSSLNKITIGDNVKIIPSYFVINDTNLVNITIPESVTSIGDYAFSYCTNLEELKISDSVTSIGCYAFNGCNKIKKPVYNSKLFVRLPLNFSGKYIISDGIEQICEGAFNKCTELSEVEIPNSVIAICNFAFQNCGNLSSVSIPNSVSSIGVYAFAYCSLLQSVYVYWENPLVIKSNVFDGVNLNRCTLYVPKGCVNKYIAANGWTEFTNIKEQIPTAEETYITIQTVKGISLKQIVEIGKTYSFLLDNGKNGRITLVKFNGEDVTSQVTNGKYTTPLISANSEIYVEYDNSPLGDTNLDGSVDVADITATASIILTGKAKEEVEEFEEEEK